MQHERKTKINTVQKQHGAPADDGIQGASAPGPERSLNSRALLALPVLRESLRGFSAECNWNFQRR